MSTGQLVGLVVAAVVLVGLLVTVLLVVRRRQRRPAADSAARVGPTTSSSPPGAAGRRRSDAVEGVDPGTAGTHRGTDPAADRGASPVEPSARTTRPTHRA